MYTRRTFLQQSAALLAVAGSPSLRLKKEGPLLAFSTLGCPDWTFAEILTFAKKQGYSGLEIRGIQRELDLPKCPEFATPAAIAATRKKVEDSGLKIINLGSSAALHHGDTATREKNLNEAKRFIDVAHQLNCPFIRVFPNDFPKEVDRNTTIERITTGLLSLGAYAKGSGVTVLMESHGQVVHSADLNTILTAAAHPNVGLVWDVVNMWAATKEAPTVAYGVLKKFIRHTHIKDLRMVDGKEQYTLLGEGESPIFEAIDALQKGAYKGYYSFEWEKLWHPELPDPELALADYPQKMKTHFERR